MSTLKKFKLALIQFTVTADKWANLKKITELVKYAASTEKANVVALPECCNSPYGNQYFEQYAESLTEESVQTFSSAAKDNQIYLIAGSIPEKKDGKVYNTSTVFGPDGKLLSTFSKVHLFDIDIPGKFSFQESKTLTGGESLTVVNTPYCKIGLGICYDLRFAEMAQVYANAGCKLLIYPSAFSMATGPFHWELLNRSRALDNQCYVAGVSPSRNKDATNMAYGHSIIVNPWGEVIAKAEENDNIICADIDLDYIDEVRSMIPIGNQKKKYIIS